jgi:hypothetical protein
MRAIYPVHLILLNLIVVNIWRRKQVMELLIAFIQPSIIYLRFSPDILFSSLLSNTPYLCSFLKAKTKFHAHTKPQAILYFCRLFCIFRHQMM